MIVLKKDRTFISGRLTIFVGKSPLIEAGSLRKKLKYCYPESKMKNINPPGLFDDHFLLKTLSKLGGPLQKLNKFINWNIFQSPINEGFKNDDRDLNAI